MGKPQKMGFDDYLLNHSKTELAELPTKEVKGVPDFKEDPRRGIFYEGVDKDGEQLPPVWICSYFEIVALSRGIQNQNWGFVFRFTDRDNIQHTWSMPAEMLKGNGDEYRGILYNMGLAISTNHTMRQHLANFIQLKARDIKARARCTDRLGWYSKTKYVHPERTFGDDKEIVIYQSNRESIKAFSQRGTLEEWQINVASLCVGNSRLSLAVSAGFAGPLLYVIQSENGGINFLGGTSIGKSTTLFAAASVSGNPTHNINLWNSTINGLEGIALQFNDGLLIVDELGEVDPKIAGGAAYMLANGQGKQRAAKGGEARDRARWRLIFLSAGEKGLAEHMQEAGKKAKAGQELRLVDVPADAGQGFGVFENLHGFDSPTMLADEIKLRAQLYHGTPFQAYIEALISNFDALAEEIENVRTAFFEAYLPLHASGQIARVAKRFALIAAAGELATALNITGWEQNQAFESAGVCFQAWLDGWGGVESKESQRLLQQVRAFFEAHGDSRFTTLDSVADRTTINRAGFRELNGDYMEFYVLPEMFKEVCAGFDSKMAAKILADKGILEKNKEGKNSITKNLPGMKSQRCYHFTAKLWGTE